MPRLVLCLALFVPALLHAAIINYNILEGCQSNFTSCFDAPPTTTTAAPSNISTPNCTTKFYNCMGNVVIDIRKPKPCYQAETAEEIFKTSVYFTVGILSFSIIAPMIPILLTSISKKLTEDERSILRQSGNAALEDEDKSCCLKFLEFLTPNEPSPEAKPGANGDAPNAAASADVNNKPVASQAADSVLEQMSRAGFTKISAIIGLAFGYVSVGWIFNLWKDWTVQDANCKFCMEAKSPNDESVRSCYW